MKLSTLVETLRKIGVDPSKSLGQNFLHDRNVARAIVEMAGIPTGSTAVEIGPGTGALTEWLAAIECRLFCVEKDGRLADFLFSRFGDRAHIRHTDALEFDTRELFPLAPVTVIGNLPYYVTSPILERFGDPLLPVRRMVFTVQRELADRLCAHPGSKDYGAISAVLQRDWEIRLVKRLPPTVFYPEPGVDSAVVAFSRREPEPCDTAVYRQLVRAGFSQRRKQLRKMVGDRFADWTGTCGLVGIVETARAEVLTVKQWAALAREAAPFDAGHAQRPEEEWFDLVDEQDQVIGRASRAEAHARDLRHRAVHVFVFNPAGDLFLQLRSRWKDKHPRVWDSSAAGHVEAGDDYASTAGRELHEELGIEATPRLVAKIEASLATDWEFVGLFCVEHEGPFRMPPAEIEGGLFFPVPLISRWIEERPQDFAPGFLKCFEIWRSESGRTNFPP